VIALAAALKDSQVVNLNLNNNQLCGLDEDGDGIYTIEGITALCQGIKQSKISTLSVRDNHIGDDGKCTLLAARPDLDLQL